MEIYIIIGSVLFFGIIFAVILIADKKRREAWQAQASQLNLSYQKDGDLHRKYASFKVFNCSGSLKSKNVVRGVYQGLEFAACDFVQTTRSRSSSGSSNSNSKNFTVYVLESERLQVPHFLLRRQIAVFDFLGKMFGGQDINYDEDQEFSEAFVLQGDDEEATRALFNKELRNFCMMFKDSRYVLEAYGTTLVLSSPQNDDPSELKDRFDQLIQAEEALVQVA